MYISKKRASVDQYFYRRFASSIVLYITRKAAASSLSKETRSSKRLVRRKITALIKTVVYCKMWIRRRAFNNGEDKGRELLAI
jgi:hypothetical protein